MKLIKLSDIASNLIIVVGVKSKWLSFFSHSLNYIGHFFSPISLEILIFDDLAQLSAMATPIGRHRLAINCFIQWALALAVKSSGNVVAQATISVMCVLEKW